MNKHAAISVRELTFSFGEHKVLSLDAFTLDAGASCAVMGPSGCGKSTLVHLLAGLLAPQSGSIHILGQDIGKLTESQRDRFRGSHIGFVFQRFHLIAALSVRNNLALAQRLSGNTTDTAAVDEILARLGISHLAARHPRTLSQGQAQRVAIARALVHRPALVIADEPTSALDEHNADEALSLLKELTADTATALLVVTHDQRVRGNLDNELQLGSLS